VAELVLRESRDRVRGEVEGSELGVIDRGVERLESAHGCGTDGSPGFSRRLGSCEKEAARRCVRCRISRPPSRRSPLLGGAHGSATPYAPTARQRWIAQSIASRGDGGTTPLPECPLPVQQGALLAPLQAHPSEPAPRISGSSRCSRRRRNALSPRLLLNCHGRGLSPPNGVRTTRWNSNIECAFRLRAGCPLLSIPTGWGAAIWAFG